MKMIDVIVNVYRKSRAHVYKHIYCKHIKLFQNIVQGIYTTSYERKEGKSF